jgi:hypothetical protein
MKLVYINKTRSFSVTDVRRFSQRYLGHYDHTYPDMSVKEQVMILTPKDGESPQECFERKLKAKREADNKAHKYGHEYRISRITYA